MSILVDVIANPRPSPYTPNAGKDFCCSRKIQIAPAPISPYPQANAFQRLRRTNSAPDADVANCTSSRRPASLSRRCHCVESRGKNSAQQHCADASESESQVEQGLQQTKVSTLNRNVIRVRHPNGVSLDAAERQRPLHCTRCRAKSRPQGICRRPERRRVATAWFDPVRCGCYYQDAGWSSPVARWAHNPKVAGSNPAPATNKINNLRRFGRFR